jgi:thioredoxin-dependent peroxiredoxin
MDGLIFTWLIVWVSLGKYEGETGGEADRSRLFPRPIEYRHGIFDQATHYWEDFPMTEWLESGKKAPDFTLAADDGTKVKLSSLRGSPVVLYFYPKDDTPGCTKEACSFRDRKQELAELGVKVLGVSPDNVASHEKFRDKFSLNFPLLADPDLQVAEKYGAWGEKILYGKKSMGIRRSTFLIDSKGVIRKVWTSVKPEGHDVQVIEAVKELQAEPSSVG